MKSSIIFCLFMIQSFLSSAPAVFIDTAFGDDGVVITDFANDDDATQALLAQPDGKIVVAGSTFKYQHYVFSLGTIS
jgi:hypothetical protein